MMFEKCENIKQVLGELAGYSSACWMNISPDVEFDSERASEAVDLAAKRIEELFVNEAIKQLRADAHVKAPNIVDEIMDRKRSASD